MRTVLTLISIGYHDAWTYTDEAIDLTIEIEEGKASARK